MVSAISDRDTDMLFPCLMSLPTGLASIILTTVNLTKDRFPTPIAFAPSFLEDRDGTRYDGMNLQIGF